MPEGSQRIALLAVLAALGIAVAAVVARRGRRSAVGRTEAPEASPEPQEYTCSCGRVYRTSGAGRHRVYWPAEAPESEPVLGDDCPECGARLPAEPEPTTA
jgi:hypothetical protein